MLVVGQRRLQFAGQHIQCSAIGIRLGEVRIQFDGLVEVVERRLELAGLSEQHAAIVERPPALGVDANRLLEIGHRRFVVADASLQLPATIERPRGELPSERRFFRGGFPRRHLLAQRENLREFGFGPGRARQIDEPASRLPAGVAGSAVTTGSGGNWSALARLRLRARSSGATVACSSAAAACSATDEPPFAVVLQLVNAPRFWPPACCCAGKPGQRPPPSCTWLACSCERRPVARAAAVRRAGRAARREFNWAALGHRGLSLLRLLRAALDLERRHVPKRRLRGILHRRHSLWLLSPIETAVADSASPPRLRCDVGRGCECCCCWPPPNTFEKMPSVRVCGRSCNPCRISRTSPARFFLIRNLRHGLSQRVARLDLRSSQRCRPAADFASRSCRDPTKPTLDAGSAATTGVATTKAREPAFTTVRNRFRQDEKYACSNHPMQDKGGVASIGPPQRTPARSHRNDATTWPSIGQPARQPNPNYRKSPRNRQSFSSLPPRGDSNR